MDVHHIPGNEDLTNKNSIFNATIQKILIQIKFYQACIVIYQWVYFHDIPITYPLKQGGFSIFYIYIPIYIIYIKPLYIHYSHTLYNILYVHDIPTIYPLYLSSCGGTQPYINIYVSLFLDISRYSSYTTYMLYSHSIPTVYPWVPTTELDSSNIPLYDHGIIWWFIPLSKWIRTLRASGLTLLIPLSGVITC